MRLIYTATRAVIPGHTLGDQYELAVPHQQGDIPRLRATRTDIPNYEGGFEHEFGYALEEWAVTTDLIQRADYPLWKEVVYSIMAGERLTFDPDSDALGVDGNPQLVWMRSKSINWRREAPLAFRTNLVFVADQSIL